MPPDTFTHLLTQPPLDQREVPEPSEVCPDCKPAGACEQLQRTREEVGWLDASGPSGGYRPTLEN